MNTKFWTSANLINGKRTRSAETIDIRDKYTSELIDTAPLAGEDQMEEAIRAAEKAFEQFRYSSAEKRAGMLQALYDGIKKTARRPRRAYRPRSGKTHRLRP